MLCRMKPPELLEVWLKHLSNVFITFGERCLIEDYNTLFVLLRELLQSTIWTLSHGMTARAKELAVDHECQGLR